MADEGDGGEKTEQPTGRRMGQARGEGMIARSVELSQVLAISTAFLMLERLAPRLWNKLIVVTTAGLTSPYGSTELTMGDMRYHLYGLILYLLPDILLLLFLTAVVGAGSTLLQTKFNFSTKFIKPNFSRLNPISGIRRLFSVQQAFQTMKAIAKLAIIGPIAYYGFIDVFPALLTLISHPVKELLPFTAVAMGKVFWPIMKLMFMLSILDYAWQWWRVSKQLKMSKVEVKDERKSTEGDERVRLKFRQIAMQRARQRMMKDVKNADVVVTNPTHYSVALKYTMEKGVAPKVIAKGKGHLALRIREIARESGIPVIERKPLARALFKMVEVGAEIPYELYSAVAELLAYVYRIKGKNPFRNRPSQNPNNSSGKN